MKDVHQPVKPGAAEPIAPEPCPDPRSSTAAPAFLTFDAVAKRLGVKYYQIQRAARAGLLPTYQLHSGRRLLKLTEVLEIIECSRQGGGQ